MPPTTTVTVTVDLRARTYSFEFSPSSTIPTGSPVVLRSVGAASVTIASSVGTPFGDMTATSAGATTDLVAGQLWPTNLSVAQLTGTPTPIIPQFTLVMSSVNPTPTVDAGDGASVVVTATANLTIDTSKDDTPANVFVGQTNNQFTMQSSTSIQTVLSDAVGDYVLDAVGQFDAPLKGKINVSSSIGCAETPGKGGSAQMQVAARGE